MVAKNTGGTPALIKAKKKELFLKFYTECGRIYQSLKRADFAPRTFRDWRNADDDFASAVDDALLEFGEKLEAEADRRAFVGTKVYKFFHGEPIAHPTEKDDMGNPVPHYELEYSDRMLELRLRAIFREKYSTRVDVHEDEEKLNNDIKRHIESIAAKRGAASLANGNGKQ